MSKNMEGDSFDHSLESFFNQLINPFSEQENHMLAQMYLYNNNSSSNSSSNNNSSSTRNDPRLPSSSALMADLDKLKGGGGGAGGGGGTKHTRNGELKDSSLDSSGELRPLKEEDVSQSQDGNSLSEEDASATKQKNRRVNQNIASRNYRNRKKEYVTSLEAKVSQLSSENDTLKKEIASLKRVDNFDSMRPDPALQMMVVELKHIISCIDDAIKRNADDNAISYLLQLFHLIVEKRHHIFEKEVEKLVNPFAQAKLAMLGYAPVLEYPSVSSISGPNADGWWNQYITEAQITREQRHKLKQMREELWKIDHDLRQERGALDKSIKEFYLHKLRVIPNYPVFRPEASSIPHPRDQNQMSLPSSSSSSSSSDSPPLADNTNIDVSDIIELSRKLNALKKNFCTQRNLMLNAFARLSQILTPRQQAMLLVRIHIHTRFDVGNAELLKNVWQSVTNSESPSVLSLLSMIPGQQPPQQTTSKIPSIAGLTGEIPMQPPTILAPHTIAAQQQQQQQQQQIPLPLNPNIPISSISSNISPLLPLGSIPPAPRVFHGPV